MLTPDHLVHALHVAAATAGAIGAGKVGGFVARRVRQPEVMGEILVGLLIAPVAAHVLGAGVIHALLPDRVLSGLTVVAEVGLALFLVGVAHELREGLARTPPGTVGWVAAGGFLPAVTAGLLLAIWVMSVESPHVRGTAPASAFVVMIAVSLTVTAVPVLARILVERGMTATATGRLALASAIVVDAGAWLGLALAVGLATGDSVGLVRSVAVLVGAGAVALGVRRLLGARRVSESCARRPVASAVLVAAVALGLALGVGYGGMTSVLGAVLAGLAVPAAGRWTFAVAGVTAVGRALVPAFFVVTGIAVLGGGLAGTTMSLVVTAIVLGVAGKILGGYAGARLAGQHPWSALRIGCLLNTRGLTELIVLRAGLNAGLLTPPMFLALLVMALATTAMTGPSLTLVDHVERRSRRQRAGRREEGG
ncbi:cation:proton antiporter [Lentzea sp. CC55]|uniref:cation:proton antiporter n=1 Tax=Lentzea sp. CC55 TaxID=2884909 RepID=UPI0027E21001|nr:cation:proton antiporter [Lentzea sp. CC55]MCG8927729.1 cation:proton antiporter [Lentzea sp. CC55]